MRRWSRGIYADHMARTRREESPRPFSGSAARGVLQGPRPFSTGTVQFTDIAFRNEFLKNYIYARGGAASGTRRDAERAATPRSRKARPAIHPRRVPSV